MSEQNHNTPRRASTGSYPGQSGGRRPAGTYTGSGHTSSRTRALNVGATRKRKTTPETVAHNAEKERFDFAELFSKKNMKRFVRHLIFYLVI